MMTGHSHRPNEKPRSAGRRWRVEMYKMTVARYSRHGINVAALNSWNSALEVFAKAARTTSMTIPQVTTAARGVLERRLTRRRTL